MAERHRRQGLAVEWIEWRQVGVLGGSPRILNETPIILQSIKQLPGNKLGASDGDIGHVKDFFLTIRTGRSGSQRGKVVCRRRNDAVGSRSRLAAQGHQGDCKILAKQARAAANS